MPADDNTDDNADAEVLPADMRQERTLVDRVRNVGDVVLDDVRRWWLVAAEPQPLGEWLKAQRPDRSRVPDDSKLLLAAWTVDNWTTGLACRIISVVLFLGAAAATWLAGHPVRRWLALLIVAALAALIVWTIQAH